jgi:cell division protein FtsL
MNRTVKPGTAALNGKWKAAPAKPASRMVRGQAGSAFAETEVQTRIVKRVPSFWIYGLLMVLAVYTAVTCVKQETQIQTVRRAMSEIQVKIDRETRNNEQLQEQKVEIASDDSIEKIAREKLGYVKDGERIFVDSNK